MYQGKTTKKRAEISLLDFDGVAGVDADANGAKEQKNGAPPPPRRRLPSSSSLIPLHDFEI